MSKLDDLGISKNSPDIMYLGDEEKLGIEQMRKIKAFLSVKAYHSKGKTVILENGENLTIEAQNSLLKTLEELSDDNLFLIGATSDANFLPTIISRCEIIRIKSQGSRIRDEEQMKDIEKLLDCTIGEKFEYIEKLKDKEAFLNSLVAYFHQNLNLHPRGGYSDFLNELLQAEQWAKQNVNIRGILEYLMISAPGKTSI